MSAFRPETAEALATADRLVKPWLAAGDDWRKNIDGLPEIEDIFVALARVREQKRPDVRVDVHFLGYSYYVGHDDSHEQFEAPTLAEAVLLLLADDLRRTCAECREYDGHDHLCPALAAEVAS